jgi:hypothetical protein
MLAGMPDPRQVIVAGTTKPVFNGLMAMTKFTMPRNGSAQRL